jgi:hypothetical protein
LSNSKFDPLLGELRTVDEPRVIGAGGGGAPGAVHVSDEAYAAGWNGVTNVAPSKNAVYDKIETLSAGSGIAEELAIAYAVAL